MRAFTTEDFLPAKGNHVEFFPGHLHCKNSRGCITDGQPLAVIGDPVSIGNLDSGGGTVPGENNVVIRVGLGQVWKQTVIGADVIRL